MKIAISAESTVDLTKELIEEFSIKTTPFTVQLGDQTCLDGQVKCDDIISFVNQNKILPKTSAVNEYQYNEHFTELLKEYDAVIHFSLSSELSLACSNAMRAAKSFSNVFVISSWFDISSSSKNSNTLSDAAPVDCNDVIA